MVDTVPGDRSTTATLRLGTPVSGALDTPGDHDWFRIDLIAGQRYSFTTSAIGDGITDTLLRLRDPSGNVVAENDDISDDILFSAISFTATTSGTYFLDVGGYADARTGAYQVVARSTGASGADTIAGDASTTGTIALGGSLNGTVDYLGDQDWFRVDLTAGTRYSFTTNPTGNGDFDTFLRLFDANGNQVAFNDDGGAALFSTLNFTATASGTYFISVGAWNDSETGNYNLRLAEAPPLTVYSNDQIATQLTTDYWDGGAHAFQLGADRTITVNITGLTGEGQTLARYALGLWSDVAGITFSETAGTAQITIDDNGSGASTGAQYANGVTTSAQVTIGTEWLATYGTSINSYSAQTYVHEIGHALGLGHAGNYNSSASYANDALYLNDNWNATIMSYFDQRENTYTASLGYTRQFIITPAVADGIAIDQLYGAATFARTGDTVYGVGNSSGRSVYEASFLGVASVTIFDDGGIDTLDLSSFSTNQFINLASEGVSNVGGLIGNLTIARTALIENAIGGAGADVIFGNYANNRLEGGGGKDTLTGGTGADVFVYASTGASAAGAGRDLVTDFVAGTDKLDLGAAGATSFIGTAAFSGAAGQVRVAGDGGNTIVELDVNGDRVADLQVELTGAITLSAADFVGLSAGGGTGARINGTAAGETLTSTGATDTLAGLGGDDTYIVNATGVVVQEAANEGTDTVVVTAAAANYLLAAGSYVEVLRAEAGTAAINVAGNGFAQLIQGNDGANILSGAGGADTLDGGLGDDVYRIFTTEDVIIDAGGFDTVYSSGTSYFLYGTAGIEYLSFAQQSSTEYAYMVGNGASQLIVGNYGDNILNGRGGNDERLPDTLAGLYGNDTYAIFSQGDVVREDAGQGNDVIYANASYQLRQGTEIEALSAVVQTASGAANAFTLIGNEYNQLVIGNDADNVLDGGLGMDTLIGRGGGDTFAFTSAPGAGNVDTVQDFVSGADRIGLASDVFAGVTAGGITAGEFLIGTAAADADDRLVYDQASGRLFYDADGNGAGAAMLFAQFAAGTAITASDFVTVAPVAALPGA